jgi:hypothetical protein
MLRELWLRFGAKSAHLYPLERAVLEEVIATSSGDISSSLRRQLELCNVVQRDGHHQRVDFFRVVNGKPHMEEQNKLPVAAGQHLLGAVRFRIPGDSRRWNAKVWAMDRELAFVGFSDSIRDVRDTADFEIEDAPVPPSSSNGP